MLFLVLLSGCGGSGVCKQRSGSGTIVWTVKTGNCGGLPNTVITSMQATAPTYPCTGTVTYSDDNCEQTVDQTCPVAGGNFMRQTGSATFSEGGAGGDGTYQLLMTDGLGATVCQGTYDGTFTKN